MRCTAPSAAVLVLLLCCLPALISARRVKISNVVQRYDQHGDVINAHDGGISLFNGTYYMYGTVYAHCHQPAAVCDGQCGYYNNTFALYTSNDLVNWTLISRSVLPAMEQDHDHVPYWMANVGYNEKTQLYVMCYWDGKYGFVDSRVAMAVSPSPLGPFKPIAPIRLKGCTTISSTTGLFVDSRNRAWLRMNTRDEPLRHVVELLNDDWTDTTGLFSVIWDKEQYPWYEGGGMFERLGLYYVMLGTDCCFCQWGGNAKVFVASDPLGNWTLQQDVNYCADGTLAPDLISDGGVNPCSLQQQNGTNFTVPAQQFNVVTVQGKHGMEYLYYGELFRSAPSGWKDEDRQAWIPLQFADNAVQIMRWWDEFTLDLPDPTPAVAGPEQEAPVDISAQ